MTVGTQTMRVISALAAGLLAAVTLLVAAGELSGGWLVALIALIGLGAAGCAALPRAGHLDDAAAQRRAQIRDRADQQHRWVLRGDKRGVYGPEGARLMGWISPEPNPLSDTGELPELAAIVYTADELAALLSDRKPAWSWAAFGSVLVQRRAAVQSRLRDQRLCYAPPSGTRADTEFEVAELALGWARELIALVDQVEQVMLSPGFQTIFAQLSDGDALDTDTVLQAAHRLMDLHDGVLKLSEQCRGLAAPPYCDELLNSLGRMIDVPLEGYRQFIDDFVATLAELPDMARFGRGPMTLGRVELEMEPDDKVEGFFKQLNRTLDEVGGG